MEATRWPRGLRCRMRTPDARSSARRRLVGELTCPPEMGPEVGLGVGSINLAPMS